MAKKGGSKIFWIIGGLVVIAGCVGAYFLLRKPKDQQLKDETSGDESSGDETSGGSTGGSIGGVATGGGGTFTAPRELNTTDKIKAFQDWLDNNKPCWLQDTDGKYKNLSKNVGQCDRNIGGKGYGTYGKNTANAWKTFGKEYLNQVKSGTADIPSNLKVFIDRKVVSKNGIIDTQFGKYVPYTFKSPNGNEFNVQFLETGYLKVLYPKSLQKQHGEVAYEGTWKDGGREITITKDNYGFGSRNDKGTTFKTGSMPKTIAKLFVSSESRFIGNDKFEFSSFDNALDLNF